MAKKTKIEKINVWMIFAFRDDKEKGNMCQSRSSQTNPLQHKRILKANSIHSVIFTVTLNCSKKMNEMKNEKTDNVELSKTQSNSQTPQIIYNETK